MRRLMATSDTRPCISSGSRRGALPASGSPLGLPFSQSKRKTNSYRLEMTLFMVFLLFMRSFFALAFPQVRHLVVVPKGEKALILQGQSSRHGVLEAGS